MVGLNGNAIRTLGRQGGLRAMDGIRCCSEFQHMAVERMSRTPTTNRRQSMARANADRKRTL